MKPIVRIAMRIVALLAIGASLLQPCAAEEAAPAQLCVNVRIGDDRGAYFDCLNAELAQEVAQQSGRQLLLQSAVDASRPESPTQLGLYNQAATRERLGDAFGHSVVPQRPQLQYVNPLISASMLRGVH